VIFQEEIVLNIEFTSEDKKEYKKLEETAQAFYKGFNKSMVSRSYLALTSRLLPLRVACAGGKTPLQEQMRTPYLDAEDNNTDDEEDEGIEPKKVVRLSEYAFTSKMKRLIQEMVAIRAEDSKSKILIFSQFATTLEWLQKELPRHGFQFRTLSGDMTLSKRARALREFQNDPPTTVFLLSMRSGAVGINLTAANRVFLLEPCFNPALEQQAIGRVWRLGQTRPVKIYRMIIKNSVEDRMLKMLKNKYGNKGEEGGTAPVGNLKNDKASMVAKEFDLLFGVEQEESSEMPDPLPVPDMASSSSHPALKDDTTFSV
jgi:SNF2 family DNA or RNA helicase